jgi:uncharacterized protein (UPF0332 family)
VPTAVPIDPNKLLEAARELVNHQEGPGRPKPVYLRRAVSSAYYALFHCICKKAACHLLGSASTDEQLCLARSFNHAAIKTTCEWITGSARAPEHAGVIVKSLSSSSIVDVALAFCALQEARHKADYDHLSPLPKETALGYIQDAERAMRSLSRARKKNQEALFCLLALKTSVR